MGSFQAIIDKVIKDPDAIVIEATYTNNLDQKVQREYRLKSFDLNAFKRTVQAQLDELESTKAATVDVNLPIGPFNPEIVPDALTPIQKFSIDLQLLRNYQNAVNLKIIDANDADYLAQLQKVQGSFDVQFIGAI